MTIEVAAALPLPEAIAENEWTLEEPIGEFEPSAAFGPGQVVRYATARWVARLRYEGLSDADRHLLAAFAASVGRHRSFWMYDPSHNRLGSFASSELLPASTSWSVTTDRAATADSDAIRMTRTGATASGTLYSPALTVTANAFYAWRCVLQRGTGDTHLLSLNAGSTGTGSNYGAGTVYSEGGRFVLRCAPTGATMYVSVADSMTLAANWTQLAYYLMRRQSAARAVVVDGGSGALTQTGTSLYVKGFDASATAGVLKAGDMVEIVSGGGSQMLRLIEDANADSSGKSWIKFEPYLRAAASDLDLVIPHRPWVKMRLVTDPALITRPGWYGSIEIECRESFV